MKQILTKLRLLTVLLAFLGIAGIAKAQTYQLYFTNVTHPATNIVEWDAYLMRTGATPLQLASIQFGFGYDISILNGGTLTAAIIAGASELPVPMQPTAINVGTVNYTAAPVPAGQTHRYINVAARPVPGAGNGPIISNTDGGCPSKGTRIGRFRITNSVPFTPNSKMNQFFSQAVGSGRTKTQINAYVGATNTNLTVDANHFSYNVAGTCDQNIFLNPVATCAVTGSGTTTPVTCFGNTDGTAEITLTGTGAGAPGTYTVDGGAAQPFTTNPFTITGLSAGNHTIVATVTAGNCVSTPILVNVGSPAAITGTATTTAVSCNGNSDGTAEITLTGGAGGGTYSLDGGASVPYAANPFTITGLSGGSHNVTATTAAGCVSNLITFNVSSPAVFAGSATSTDATCGGGGNNGTATVTMTGGNSQAPGTYTLDGGSATPYSTNPFTITGLAPGSHSIVVTAGACTAAPIAVFINAPATFSATFVKTNISACNATNDGTITITPAGGTAPYTYVWSGGYPGFAPGNVSAVTNLPIGFYNVTVTDAGGCGVVVLNNIHVQFAFTVLVTNSGSTTSACGNNGTIILYGNAGVQPYTYSIDGTTYQTSNLFTGLAAGTYTGYIKDAAGCVGTKPNIVIAAAAPIVVNPFVRNASSCSNDGSIEVYRTGGIPPYTYSLDNVTFQTSNVFSGLAAGAYTAYVKDSKGCVGSQSATVGQGAALSLSTLVTNTSTCTNDGTVRVTVSGGVAPFTYSIGGPSQSSNLFAGLAAGSYTVTATDSKGCTGTTNVTVNLNTINVTASAVAASSCALNNGSIQLFRTGGVGPYTYSLDGNLYQTSPLFTGLAAGTYTGYVKDSKGCIGQLAGIQVGPSGCTPPIANNSKGVIAAPVETAVTSLKVQAYPNPSNDEFTLVLSGYKMTEQVSIVITDVMGRKVYQAQGTGKQQYRFGKSFFAGLYTVQVIQGTDKKSLKLVKE